MHPKTLIFYTIVLASITSCNDQPTCIPEQTDLVKITFVDVQRKAKSITLTSIFVDNSNEYFPSIADTTASQFSIPLNPIDSSIIIRFQQEDSILNYLALSYVATPVVLNQKCAIETKFDYLRVDSTNFKNAIVTEILLNPKVTKNIEITH